VKPERVLARNRSGIGSAALVLSFLLVACGQPKETPAPPTTDLDQLREAELGSLNSYDVIDKATGKYQVPIQQEIAVVVANPKLLEPLVELPDLDSMTPLQRGKYLFENTYGCASCHALNGTVIKGPHLNGRWREGPSIISTGEAVPFTDDYFKESELYSQAKIVQGFPPIMPVFAGRMPEKDMLAIMAYLKSL
jgi:hypothetical protein